MIHCLIFAGGTGSRVSKSEIPKQFIEINDKPIIIHTLEYFNSNKEIDDITVVCLSDWIDKLNLFIDEYNITKVDSVIAGGKTGYESIDRGLNNLVSRYEGNDIVLICDGVRPVLSDELISDCIKYTRKFGNAVPVTRSIDSILISEDGKTVDNNLSREKVFITQAPQGYILKDIVFAHKEAEIKGIKDPISSADLMVQLKKKVYIFVGDRRNIKVTTDEDLEVVKLYL